MNYKTTKTTIREYWKTIKLNSWKHKGKEARELWTQLGLDSEKTKTDLKAVNEVLPLLSTELKKLIRGNPACKHCEHFRFSKECLNEVSHAIKIVGTDAFICPIKQEENENETE